jgi:hypothetical protein
MSTGDARLIDRIRKKFDVGALPREHPKTVSGGYGMGDACNGCGEPILRAQGVYEFDVATQTYRLHSGCYGLWEGELIRRGLFKPQ